MTAGTTEMTLEQQIEERKIQRMKALAEKGWVRVDGIRYRGSEERVAKTEESKRGKLWFDANNGVAAIGLPDGQVWIQRVGNANLVYAIPNLGMEREQGMFVPCSNGEELDQSELLLRFRAPMWEPTQA